MPRDRHLTHAACVTRVTMDVLAGRRNSTDSSQSNDWGADAGEKSLGPKELLEKRRQKKRRDTAVRFFHSHRGLYETQEDRTLKTELTATGVVRKNNSMRDESELTLLQACKTGHSEMVEALMEARVAVDSVDEWGNTGLILAAMHGHADVVHALLYPRSGEDGAGPMLPANPNVQNRWAGTALIESAARGMR